MTIVDILWPPIHFMIGFAVFGLAFEKFMRGSIWLWDNL